MNAPLAQTFADLTRPLMSMASHDRADRLGDTWRHALSGIREDIRFIGQYRKVIAEKDELLAGKWPRHSAAYVSACRTNLATTLKRYTARVRAITEAEQEMTALGIPFATSSDAWDAMAIANRRAA
ncbi:hypothetical protein QV13_12640 [Mesorhizobium hungaricum]|jgi:hypothetical protein|uniref:Uncharacterized protein n=1 Tax=Mesorhizobium hungaricum TaxID=1566387 RepID=A0A1C2DS69_9HYPH|nr:MULTISPECIES: hypothetical protein [Mesorhizobium]MBN9236036.1 hypothetical protein [Mesorhizobium sp.]OCX17599.1 hypothetical protein QV13_12640 [Mesorhizobium hungaricum]